MRVKIHRYCSWIFFIVLILYGFSLYQGAYIGVFLHQVSWVLIIVSGLLARMTREKRPPKDRW
ncbi:hypothetical protein CGB73_15925 [Klebsiella sp. 11263]|nr:hypothetical protein [Klebsiella sp. CVUAS 11263]MBW6033254.1 hypothetical protein [Klebsiella sp. CVUAS 11332]